MSTVLIAFFVFLGPVILAVLNGRTSRKQKREDWAREDEVARRVEEAQKVAVARAEEAARLAKEAQEYSHKITAAAADKAAEAAKLLLQHQAATDEKLEEVARVAAEAARQTEEQLKAIHTLVNSDMTAARLAELVQARLTLAATRKVIRLDEDAGRDASKEDLEAVEATEARIVELTAILADRLEAQRRVEAEQAQRKLEGEPPP